MSLPENPISRHLRKRKREIATVWEGLVRAEVRELAALDPAALIDHLPEFLEGLALWVEGETAAARAGLYALAEGHAIQRLGYGIDLVTLTREYMLLRSTILRELMAVPTSEQGREWMLRINEGIDVAVHQAVERYERARGSGMRTALVRVDMGLLCEQAIDGRAIAIEQSGDLRGMWDPVAILDVLQTAFAGASAVSVREADDHQRVLVTAVGVGAARLPDPICDRVVAHGGRVVRDADRLTFEWPRTPHDEAPQRT